MGDIREYRGTLYWGTFPKIENIPSTRKITHNGEIFPVLGGCLQTQKIFSGMTKEIEWNVFYLSCGVFDSSYKLYAMGIVDNYLSKKVRGLYFI